MTAFKKMVLGALCIIAQSGCATFKSLDADVPLAQRIFIYSGTRLDWAALENNDVAIRKFNTTPPSLPLIDLPFSFALDTLFLPLAVSAEIFH
ncbi:MAG: YceK/YidQ family lipoprotein [Methylomonas sp.]|nr:MAG: YceK/YidQ family lipoprotein [Methylomonas sp.]